MEELLGILRTNAREKPEAIAKMLNLSVAEVERQIGDYERRGIIRGYRAIIDEEKTQSSRVTALIEVKVTPVREDGFDHIARRVSEFPEVQTVYLLSGTFDLLLLVVGETLKEVASFVSAKLAPLEGVTSTCSHFLLKTYKLHGLVMEPRDEYKRLKVSP